MINRKQHPLIAVWRSFTEEDMKNLPATQQDAFSKESMYYFTGKPCKHGHIAPKFRGSRYCVVCNSKNYKKSKIPVKKVEVEKPKQIFVFGMKVNGLLNKNKE